MTLKRLLELYQAEQQGKQIMVKVRHSGYYNHNEHTEKVKIAECELQDLVLDKQEGISTTFFIRDEEI